MIRTLFRRGLRIGVIVGAILFLIQVFLRSSTPKRTASERPTGPQGPVRQPPARAAAPTVDDVTQLPAEPTSTDDVADTASADTTATITAATESATAADATSAGESTANGAATWVEPDDGSCPVTHPVKVKLASGIFHVPGGLAYDRTAPDRCYRDTAAAEADGFRSSKR